MTLTLPYDFDTSRVWRTILQGVAGLALVVAAGFVYSLLVRHTAAAVQLGLTMAVILFFGRIFLRHSTGSIGSITRDRVVVRRGRLFGVTLPGPSGDFSPRQFSAVRIERVSGPTEPGVQGGAHERIYLVGAAGTPSILIARTNRSGPAAPLVGQEIATLLNLPCEETRAPY